MTPEIKNDEKHKSLASTECHAVSSASSYEDDAGRDPRDLGITSLLSAAAHIDPLELLAESSALKEKEASVRGLSARRKAGVSSRDGRGAAPKSLKSSSLDDNEAQSAFPQRKRKGEVTSNVYDPDRLAKKFRMVQPSPAELEAANTDRTMNALLSWYERLRELHMFKALNGHVDVPQQYPENHALGIVSYKLVTSSRCFMNCSHTQYHPLGSSPVSP